MPNYRLSRRNTHSSKSFICRLCRQTHALRVCRKFLNMNTTQRKEATKRYGYCQNCLAHSHSQGSCFTKTGCKYCHKKHHSLLHTHSRLNRPAIKDSSSQGSSSNVLECRPSTSKSFDQKRCSTATASLPKATTLVSLLKQNILTLLPTALVNLDTKRGKRSARCLLDSASKISCISEKIVEKMHLTTLELEGEVICPIKLYSCVDSNIQIDAILRVNNRISTRTPSENLPESTKRHFQNMILADKYFDRTSSIDIILGIDVYSRIIRDGLFIRPGLPTGQNTVFGIVIYGTVFL